MSLSSALDRAPSPPLIPLRPLLKRRKNGTQQSMCNKQPRKGSHSRSAPSMPPWRSSSFTFMKDPLVGLREMARVTSQGGVVAACVWDHDGGGGPLSLFWAAVGALDPGVEGEAQLAGAREGHLAELFREAGLASIADTCLSITVTHPSFEDWWEPFTFGVGPAGSYVVALDATSQIRLRDRCRAMLPSAPFTLKARAWAARGLAR
jgi:hypothetical protein